MNEKLSLVPNKPGCYLMKNKDNVIIYVGKAKDLKKRVSSYFNREHTGKTAKLVSEITDFEYIQVNSETESLILEINLIKKQDPKYNILLRDDKSYPYIEITNEKVPRLLVIRNLNKNNKNPKLYGPFPNVTAARKTVDLLNRIYPLKKCRNYPKKPCLYYHINQCLGYCVYEIEQKKIDIMVDEISRFLNGEHQLITKKLKINMEIESNKLNYEKALEYKVLLDYIEATLIKQTVELNDKISKDVFGYYVNNGYLSIQVFFIRNGKIIERNTNIIPIIDDIENEINRYIAKFYDKFIIPKEILVPSIVDDRLLEDYLKTKVIIPKIGTKLKIVNMVNENAKIELDNQIELINRNEERTYLANTELKKILKLDKLDRIEIFDNSHLFGTYTVSGMVVFENGLPNKNEYRKYKLETSNEYDMMKEVIYRRYFRILKDDLIKPDLIIVDGGIGQINITREILSSLNLLIPVVGLKKDNKHTTESLIAFDSLEELKIDKKSNLFYYLERMQDEVHRYVISYHKQIRSKGSLESVLDNVVGIGKTRKEELIKKYKSINKLQELTIDELKTILPDNVAINLYEFLKNYNK